ncbi:hypothetical protein [Staphylococcus gallinarum]|uniref:hypothetical protein n=1 Tax=Staphylococcus gallinarum TaxID=1293 RepID=UPI001E3E2F5B|nr:hypothetical protein [Staphylococcus gallinarum]MCD8845184.1 hypothetical protein [Staphylococcus gallinarum]
MEDNISRPRIRLDYDLYEKVKESAKKKKMNKDEYIATALEHFIEFEKNNFKEEDIYTQRLNELTQAIYALQHELASNHEGLNNRLNILLDYQSPPSYLNE